MRVTLQEDMGKKILPKMRCTLGDLHLGVGEVGMGAVGEGTELEVVGMEQLQDMELLLLAMTMVLGTPTGGQTTGKLG